MAIDDSKMQALRLKYAESLPDKRRELEHAIRASLADHSMDSHLKPLVHKLAGSAGAYGYSDLGDAARNIDQMLNPESDSPDRAALGQACDRLLARFDVALAGTVTDNSKNADAAETSSTVSADSAQAINRLLIIEDDEALADWLKQELPPYGYKPDIWDGESSIVELLTEQHYQLLLVDLTIDNNPEYGIDILRTVDANPGIKTVSVVISARDDLHTRLRCANAGARYYFSKPLDIPTLATTLAEAVPGQTDNDLRVLVIDDDTEQANMLSTHLADNGFSTQTLTQLDGLLESLVEFQPELLLMDLNMPQYDGIDLTRVIRQHQNWFDLPIVIHSASDDMEQRRRALDAGADFFLPKQMAIEDLAQSLRRRIRRARRVQQLSNLDPLTGVLNRNALTERIVVELSRAQREAREVCLIVLDIDRFKLINDNHGHLVGDLAIIHLTNRLRQSLRSTDLLGRFGGDEIIVVLPDTALGDGMAVMEKARQDIESHPVEAGDKRIPLTASMGLIAHVLEKHDNTRLLTEELLQAADEQLYKAKEGGRNRVCGGHLR